MKPNLAIGVDLGATKIATALITREGKVLASRQTATQAASGPAAVFDRIAAEIQALRDAAPGEIAGVGIGSAGLIDSASGVVLDALNLAWKNVPLGSEVSLRIGKLSVFVENDANANVLGEGYFGSAIGFQHYLLLTLGSGLGAGVISHGKLVTGPHMTATNLGHYSIDPDNGRMCGCGSRGCAETIACGPGLVDVMRSLRDTPKLTSQQIVAAARQGDGVALTAIAEVAAAVGHVAAAATSVLGSELLVIGGGLGTAIADLIRDDVAREMRRRLPVNQAVPQIRPATLASPAVGAATLVWERSR